MEIKKIGEFNVGDFIEGYYLIKSVNIKTSSNNKTYLDLNLADKTGEINAKLWDCSKEDIKLYTDNILIKVRGNVTEWQGKLQLKITKIRPVGNEEGIKIDDFVPTAPLESEKMYSSILEYVDKIKNSDIRNIVIAILEEGKDKLLFYPAAKSNHHALKGGLLYHILTMLRAGEALCNVYTHLNTDLVYGGVILHDMSKLDEMEASEIGIVSEYTKEGQLLGHIIQGIKNIEKIAERLGADKEVALMLQHMVLTHHYEPEFGSPKKPMIPEAELLHYLDIIDARMFDMTKALEGVSSGGFSDRIWVLDNRKIYKADIDKNSNID